MDPLSPFLFLIVVDVLSRIILKVCLFIFCLILFFL